jgi:hypothetical protein
MRPSTGHTGAPCRTSNMAQRRNRAVPRSTCVNHEDGHLFVVAAGGAFVIGIVAEKFITRFSARMRNALRCRQQNMRRQKQHNER